MNTQSVGRSVLLLILALGVAPSAASAAPLSDALGKLPLDFVANRGQWGPAVKFAARKGEMAAAFGDRDITLRLGKAGATSLALTFEGASSDVHLAGEDERAGHYNFAIGNDRVKWRSAVPAYGALRYRRIYPGIDVRVREERGQLEYELLLAPGSDLRRMVMRAEGASGLEIASDGALIVRTTSGSLRQTPPVTWEELPGGERRPLASRFRIIDGQRYGFEAPGRDARLAMVVDPGLVWSTFLGGSSREFVSGLAASGDGSGDLIVAGTTTSADFPTSPSLPPGGNSMFVARLTADGKALAYVTFLGGTGGTNIIFGLVSDTTGGAVIAGVTDGVGFPTTAGTHRRIPAGAGEYPVPPGVLKPVRIVTLGVDVLRRFPGSRSPCPPISRAEAGEPAPGDPVEGRGCRVRAPWEGKMPGTPSPETISTRLQRIADRVHDGVPVAQQTHDLTLPSPPPTRPPPCGTAVRPSRSPPARAPPSRCRMASAPPPRCATTAKIDKAFDSSSSERSGSPRPPSSPARCLPTAPRASTRWSTPCACASGSC